MCRKSKPPGGDDQSWRYPTTTGRKTKSHSKGRCEIRNQGMSFGGWKKAQQKKTFVLKQKQQVLIFFNEKK